MADPKRQELGGKGDELAAELGLGETEKNRSEAPEGSGARGNIPVGAEDEFGDYPGSGPDLEDQFAGMRLHGKEEEDLDFSVEVEDLVKDVRWLALFRVHTTKPFSHAALLSQMRNAWSAAQGVTFNIKGPNLFLVQCHCLGDWRKIMEGGPWLFRRAPVVVQEYDGFSNVNEYRLNRVPVWARIKGLPDGLTQKRELAKKVAAKVGEPPFTVIVNEGRINPASTLRARVFVDVNEPLVRFVPITLKEHKKYSVFYEKLPDFCFACGRMGHLADECGDGVHNLDSFEWGDWLLWEPELPAAQPYGGRGRGGGIGRGRGGESGRGERGRGGRGQMGGRGGGVPADADSVGSQHMDLDDRGVAQADEGDKGSRKRLVAADGSINIRGQQLSHLAGKDSGTVLLIEGATTSGSNNTTVSTPEKVHIVKKRRQEGEEGDETMQMEKAASLEEGRRA
ncbi:hypothetical protein VPH35_059016 [Triticum aestivum]